VIVPAIVNDRFDITIETVEFAGVSAARAAMIEKLAELLDEAPASLVDHPDSKVLRGLRGLRRE